MKFRRNLFLVLSLIAILWFVAGLSTVNTVVSSSTPEPGSSRATQAGQATANVIVSGVSIGVLACTGFLPAMMFLFLSWRNHAGWVNKVRYEEQLAAIQGLKP